MKVFISWSGELSKQVAQLLGSWIEDVLQGTKAWVSTDDIEKGTIWFNEITSQLADTGVGIVCLTRDNFKAPWILFEAGALSKGLTKSRVCPFLVDLTHTDITPPLSEFNGTLPTKEDMLKLIKTINSIRGESALAAQRLDKIIDKWWPEFDATFQKIVKDYEPKTPIRQRSVDDKIEELLEITRSLQRQLSLIREQPERPSPDLWLRLLSGDNTPLNLYEANLVRNFLSANTGQLDEKTKKYVETYAKLIRDRDKKKGDTSLKSPDESPDVS
ncbi:MAG: toll/interleukin-1 receptor domain-containing protein [Bacteroidota bacterium]|jgi:hypothetical protein